MASTVCDSFLAEFHAAAERARSDQGARIERDEQARLTRPSRVHELAQHITRRFAGAASPDLGSDLRVEYARFDPPNGESLPVTYVLHWRVSQPHRTLKILLSEQTGRFWFHLLVADALSGSEQIVANGHGTVEELTIADVDGLIRRLADQRVWQDDVMAERTPGGHADASPVQ